MRFLKYFSFFLFLSNSVIAQNDFNLGLKYFNQGNFVSADSCFTLYSEQFPDDINGVYNLSITKLYLKDTCSFCEGIFSINNPYEIDKNAVELYFDYCGNTDTTFYDKNDEIVKGSKYKYFKVQEYHRCKEYIIGKYHYKKAKIEIALFSLNVIKDYKTDIFAAYQIYPDNRKVYTLTESLPTFKEEDATIWQYVLESPVSKLAKEELNLDNNTIQIEYIVNKDGRTSSLRIVGSELENEKLDSLLEYLRQIFNEIPDYIPGKFNHEAVDYKLTELLVW